MTDIDVTARLGARIDALGGTWMGGPVMAVGAELGFEGDPWPFYMVGRGGVLGDASPESLYDAMVFPSPRLVRSAWGEGRSRLTPEEGVQRFIACAYDWADDALTSGADLERATALLEPLALSVDCTDAPLAEGWRGVARPTALPQRAVWAIQVLREQRGAVHAAAVLAAGLSPVEAVMATEGEMMAEMYGWERPLPDPEVCAARKLPVERATNEAVAATYTALGDDALAELADLLESVVPTP